MATSGEIAGGVEVSGRRVQRLASGVSRAREIHAAS